MTMTAFIAFLLAGIAWREHQRAKRLEAQSALRERRILTAALRAKDSW